MISVKDLTKRYARTTAVDHISFEVGKGQIVGFLGPNGAGKTTTMRMLTCFLPPSAGTAQVAGFDVLEQPLEVKRAHRLSARDAADLPRDGNGRVPEIRRQAEGALGGRSCRSASTTSATAAPSPTSRKSFSENFPKAIGSASDWRRPSFTILTC